MKNPHIEEVIKKLESKANVINDSLWYVDPQDIIEVFQEYQRQVREMVEGKKVIPTETFHRSPYISGKNECADDILSHPLLNDNK